MASVAFGAVAGVICAYAVALKTKFGFDDALDVVGIHFMGGLIGSLLIGLFADGESAVFGGSASEPAFESGLFFGGGLELLLEQAIANAAVMVYGFAVTFALLKGLDAIMGIRVSRDDEQQGLDLTTHSETAYHQVDQ